MPLRILDYPGKFKLPRHEQWVTNNPKQMNIERADSEMERNIEDNIGKSSGENYQGFTLAGGPAGLNWHLKLNYI